MSEADLRALTSDVFDERCGLGIVRIGSATASALLPEEAGAMRQAIPSRVREFAAGRAAARIALGWPCPVPMAEDRAPIWPSGWAGSISHGAGWAIAIARQGARLVGVDVESDEDLPADILSEVLTLAEARRHGADLRVARRIFAIKEAVYKAQYPVTREIFDFQTLEVALDGRRFGARFAHPVGPFRRDEVIAGIWASGQGLILAGVLG